MFGVFRSSPTSTITPNMKSLVSRAVIEVPEGRRRYLERMSELLTNVFKMDVLTNRLQQLANEVRPVLANDPAALVSLNFAVARLSRRMVERAESVARQLERPSQPLAFDETGQARLPSWKPQRDSGNPFFSNNSIDPQLGRVLEIGASGEHSYGSWRTTILLEQGEYELVGKAQVEAFEAGPGVTKGGVTLRMSGERAARMVT